MLTVHVAFPDSSLHTLRVSQCEVPRVIASKLKWFVEPHRSIALLYQGEVLCPVLTFYAQGVHDGSIISLYYIKKVISPSYDRCSVEQIMERAEKKRNYELCVEYWRTVDSQFLQYEVNPKADIIFQNYLNESCIDRSPNCFNQVDLFAEIEFDRYQNLENDKRNSEQITGILENSDQTDNRNCQHDTLPFTVLDDGKGSLNCEPLPICFTKEFDHEIERTEMLIVTQPNINNFPTVVQSTP
ncbi:hypothetical protein TRFO_27522 [Tritrichomonas foetus]|uniref:Uncharacterized protein n=1 Tax=Tritrichomonas foetus TaxID=1144522 RepID=A0A1J4K0H1_9EUKA|nr:hypothetical protein TRFO_27522 [Tritrichomonas foetus]|eukprot:OHT04903.1 hypothetical protein TRFO_27522 [Tritrichomonas foetus]